MTRYLLDTNVLSEVRKPRPHPGFMSWWKSLDEDRLFISVMTIGEIYSGIRKIERQQPANAEAIRVWVSRLEHASSGRVLAIDRDVVFRWAGMHSMFPQRGVVDLLIAATAAAHDLTIATRNVRDFDGLGIALLNPFIAN